MRGGRRGVEGVSWVGGVSLEELMGRFVMVRVEMGRARMGS